MQFEIVNKLVTVHILQRILQFQLSQYLIILTKGIVDIKLIAQVDLLLGNDGVTNN